MVTSPGFAKRPIRPRQNNEHPPLEQALRIKAALEGVLPEAVKAISEAAPPAFLSTVALNLWSPYIPRGRYTTLGYPKNSAGQDLAGRKGGVSWLHKLHMHYFALFGRNISSNRILYEMKEAENVRELIVDAAAGYLEGPTVQDHELDRALFSLPHSDELRELGVLPLNFEQFLETFRSDESGRFQFLLRDSLARCRENLHSLTTDSKVRKAFASHVGHWLERGHLGPASNLSEYFDQWLCRIQMTAIASRIWGSIWISRRIPTQGALDALSFTVTLTVTGGVDPDIVHLDAVRDFASTCEAEINKRLPNFARASEKKAVPYGLHERLGVITDIAMRFSASLGGDLIGADHEGKKLNLIGLLTEGLDSLDLGPSEFRVLYEIPDDEVKLEDLLKDASWWDLYEALFESNSYFLTRKRIALQFELDFVDGYLLPRPRHIVELAAPVPHLFQRLANRRFGGLLRLGFEVDESRALHVRSGDGTDNDLHVPAVTTAVQRFKNESLAWEGNSPNTWTGVAESLYGALTAIRHNRAKFYRDAADVLKGLAEDQLRQLANGVVEVRREQRGCLVFLGPLYERLTPGTLESDGHLAFICSKTVLDITRLGLCFEMVSQIPDSYAQDFSTGFADLAGMDGETVICSIPNKVTKKSVKKGDRWRPLGKGAVFGRRFVQLPSGIPSLVSSSSSGLAPEYRKEWDEASRFELLDPAKGGPIKIGTISRGGGLQREDLLSLGTRHRKAAATTKASRNVVAITCSASGGIRIWVRGVPVLMIVPDSGALLPNPPKLVGELG